MDMQKVEDDRREVDQKMGTMREWESNMKMMVAALYTEKPL